MPRKPAERDANGHVLGNVGPLLRAARLESGYTLRAAAGRLLKTAPISHMTILNYENGRSNPNLETLGILARVYGKDVASFLHGMPPARPLPPAPPPAKSGRFVVRLPKCLHESLAAEAEGVPLNQLAIAKLSVPLAESLAKTRRKKG